MRTARHENRGRSRRGRGYGRRIRRGMTVRPTGSDSDRFAPGGREALALVHDFFDALGHFAGELPSLPDLERVVAPSAEIVEGRGEARAERRFTRARWLERVRRCALRCEPTRGRFLDARARIVSVHPGEVRVGCVVREMWSRARSVEHIDTFRCEVSVQRARDRVVIGRVVVQRSFDEASDAISGDADVGHARGGAGGAGTATGRAVRRP